MTATTAEQLARCDTKAMIDRYREVRTRTMQIVAPLEIEDYVIQTAEFMSPPRWHLGHTSWFFETVLQSYKPGYRVYSEDYLYYFNSYYEGFGPRIERAKRGTRARPTVKETIAYRKQIDELMIEFIDELSADRDADTILSLLRLGLEHEMQHQELLVYDIKHLLCEQYDAPLGMRPVAVELVEGMSEVEGGLFWLGYSGIDFAFDNEKPAHQVWLQNFAIDRAPVSNGDFLEFIQDGGYQNYHWWLAEAWDVVSQQGWQAPLYWELHDWVWIVRDFSGLQPAASRANDPVSHVSYFEAAAFAKWAGKRLPTEAEWEKAACFSPEKNEIQAFPWGDVPPDKAKANLFENQLWSVAPIGAFAGGQSAYGCHQMIGDVWEWTTSDYVPYPGFKSEFEEYNDKWFVGQKVLRGGSFATPQLHIRPSYRNFFHPHERWMISGFRCAKDL
jgi:ergothioneine biosynthesis protein EgtB